MKAKGKLLWSQDPTTCPYPEPDQSSSHLSLPPTPYFLKIHFYIILPSTLTSPKFLLEHKLKFSCLQNFKSKSRKLLPVVIAMSSFDLTTYKIHFCHNPNTVYV